MTEYDLNVAKQLGSLEADMRTVKHDVNNISAKIDALSNLIGNVKTQQSKSLGFFAGMAFVITSCSALLISLGKLLFGSHGG